MGLMGLNFEKEVSTIANVSTSNANASKDSESYKNDDNDFRKVMQNVSDDANKPREKAERSNRVDNVAPDNSVSAQSTESDEDIELIHIPDLDTRIEALHDQNIPMLQEVRFESLIAEPALIQDIIREFDISNTEGFEGFVNMLDMGASDATDFINAAQQITPTTDISPEFVNALKQAVTMLPPENNNTFKDVIASLQQVIDTDVVQPTMAVETPQIQTQQVTPTATSAIAQPMTDATNMLQNLLTEQSQTVLPTTTETTETNNIDTLDMVQNMVDTPDVVTPTTPTQEVPVKVAAQPVAQPQMQQPRQSQAMQPTVEMPVMEVADEQVQQPQQSTTANNTATQTQQSQVTSTAPQVAQATNLTTQLPKVNPITGMKVEIGEVTTTNEQTTSTTTTTDTASTLLEDSAMQGGDSSEFALDTTSDMADELLKNTSSESKGNNFDNMMKSMTESVKMNSETANQANTKFDVTNTRDITRLVTKVEQIVVKGESALTVTLTPEHLGKMEIRLAEVGGKLVAKLTTENETSHKMMVAHGDAIRQQLADKGIVIDNMEFAFNDTSKQESGDRNANRKNQGNNKKAFNIDGEMNEVGTEVATQTNKADNGLYA